MRCAFEAGVYVADWEQWKAADTTKQIEQWMKWNMDEELYICGSQPPLMAVFYDYYDDLHKATGDSTSPPPKTFTYYPLSSLDWEHVVSLGHPYDAGGRPEDYENKVSGKTGVIEWNGDKKPWVRLTPITQYLIPCIES